ncbi:MAG: hypothetical protein ACJ75Q_04540 [Gaiellaceae bacterium]
MKIALLLLSTVLFASACGGDDGGRPVFARAQEALGRVDALRAHLAVRALAVDRTATIARADLPLERLHLSRWAKHQRPFPCGHGFECVRGDLDVAAAARDLAPVLPQLPFDPAEIASATVEVRLDSRGELHRIDLRGHLAGADVELDLRPVG